MTNLASVNWTNMTTTMISNYTREDETQDTSIETGFLITIIAIVVNSITCPFSVSLNVLVVMAVKRRSRLQSKANILLACLAVTDVLTGLLAQPSFMLWKVLSLLDIEQLALDFNIININCLRFLLVCSSLHVMLVVCERLVAIKLTFRYPNIVTVRNMKLAVLFCWVYSFLLRIVDSLLKDFSVSILLVVPVLVCCIVFVLCSYVILYRETCRHKKMMKTRQLLEDEQKRVVKENKALMTSVLVVGALVFCLLPGVAYLLLRLSGVNVSPNSTVAWQTWIRSAFMLNSLLNPLIYCWRQKEIRNFVLKRSALAVHPSSQARNSAVQWLKPKGTLTDSRL